MDHRKRSVWRKKKIKEIRRGAEGAAVSERRGEGSMNLKAKTYVAVGATLLLSAVALQAQRHGGPDGPFGAAMELMGFEGMHGDRVVKSAPFSATATSDMTQTLQDGSAIHRTSQVTMYRDSQGRSRHEATFNGFGLLTPGGTPKSVVLISDPVAGTHTLLDKDSKTAHQMPFHPRGGSAAENSSPDATFQSRMQEREEKEIAAGLLKKESLGTQTINGIVAEGTRTTRTIPAGQIGNDKPLQVVSERWYSPDLQIVLKSTRTDPRFGTTTYTVNNIQRTEPAANLFTVPADFTVKTGGPGLRHGGPGGPPAEMPPPPDEE
jgi:hypothetical protein